VRGCSHLLASIKRKVAEVEAPACESLALERMGSAGGDGRAIAARHRELESTIRRLDEENRAILEENKLLSSKLYQALKQRSEEIMFILTLMKIKGKSAQLDFDRILKELGGEYGDYGWRGKSLMVEGEKQELEELAEPEKEEGLGLWREDEELQDLL
jgi:hypothetical protein